IMSDPKAPRDASQERHFGEPSLDGGRGTVSQHVHCRLAAGTGPGFTDEMASLLRTRLRLAILIILVGFAAPFLGELLLLGSAFHHSTPWLVFSGCEIAAMVIASALLWSRRPLSMR